jgi:hypothetical protein
MASNKDELYRLVRIHPSIVKLGVKDKNLLISRLYGKNQIAMLTLDELHDLYRRLTADTPSIETKQHQFVPVSELLKQ